MTGTDLLVHPQETSIKSMQDKVAIVTGASSGIGRATARALAAAGAHVVIADLASTDGELVANEIYGKGESAIFIPTDVSDDLQVSNLVAQTIDRFGRLDAAFNNAGIEGVQAPTAECTLENWNHTLAVDLTGVFLCMRHEIPRMLEHGGGSIVNCASVAGLVGFQGIPAYAASKHGVIGLTKTAALEYATQGIRVNAVCPGIINTPMIERFTKNDPTAVTQLEQSEPVHRLGAPEEVAALVLWLCSDAASFVTGQAIAVDGGFVAQ